MVECLSLPIVKGLTPISVPIHTVNSFVLFSFTQVSLTFFTDPRHVTLVTALHTSFLAMYRVLMSPIDAFHPLENYWVCACQVFNVTLPLANYKKGDQAIVEISPSPGGFHNKT